MGFVHHLERASRYNIITSNVVCPLDLNSTSQLAVFRFGLGSYMNVQHCQQGIDTHLHDFVGRHKTEVSNPSCLSLREHCFQPGTSPLEGVQPKQRSEVESSLSAMIIMEMNQNAPSKYWEMTVYNVLPTFVLLFRSSGESSRMIFKALMSPFSANK